jgi:hypothetical protein
VSEILEVLLGLIVGSFLGLLPASSPLIILTIIGPSNFSPFTIVASYAAYDLVSTGWMINLTNLGDNPSLQGSMARLVKQGSGASAMKMYAMFYYMVKITILAGSIPLLLLGTRLFSAVGSDIQALGTVVFIVSVGLMFKRHGWTTLVGLVGALIIGYWASKQDSFSNIPVYIGMAMFGITSLISEVCGPSAKPVKQWLDVSGEAHWSLAIFCGFMSSILWGINDSLMWDLLNGSEDTSSDANKIMAGSIMKGTSSGLTLVMALQASGAKHELGEILGQSGYVFIPTIALSMIILLLVLTVVGYSNIEGLMKFSEKMGGSIGTRGLAIVSLVVCVGILVAGVGPIGSILLVGVGLGMKLASGNSNVGLLVIASLPIIGMLSL